MFTVTKEKLNEENENECCCLSQLQQSVLRFRFSGKFWKFERETKRNENKGKRQKKAKKKKNLVSIHNKYSFW